jgi:hypothetical protein
MDNGRNGWAGKLSAAGLSYMKPPIRNKYWEEI